jgi:hypothetical protein
VALDDIGRAFRRRRGCQRLLNQTPNVVVSVRKIIPPDHAVIMPEIRTVTTLIHKRDEIRASIRIYEAKIAQARSDLSHVTAVLRLFEASGKTQELARYMDSYRLFKRGEPRAICAKALAGGPLATKELALELVKAKGMDTGDAVLAKTIGHRLIHSLRMQEQRGKVRRDGKRHR